MDLVDMSKFVAENNDYNWILTIIDVFSKYLWAIPLFTKDQVSVTNALLQLFAIIGTPEVLQSDNGKEFNNGVIKPICKMLKVSSVSKYPYKQFYF